MLSKAPTSERNGKHGSRLKNTNPTRLLREVSCIASLLNTSHLSLIPEPAMMTEEASPKSVHDAPFPDSIPHDQPFEIIVLMTGVPTDQADDFAAIINNLTRETVAREPAALIFQPYRAVQHPDGGVDFMFRERWANRAAFEQHQQAGYTREGLGAAAARGLLGGFRVWFITPLAEGRPDAVKDN